MVRWAKNVPLYRRRQTAALVLWMCLMPLLLLCFFLLFLWPRLIPYLLAYAVFVSLDPSPEVGARKVTWMRKLMLWRHIRDYFPVRFVKTTDLDPRHNYIFGYHPHGIIGLGAFVSFGTEANGFSQEYPGINLRVLTLLSNFKVPLWREVLLSLGFGSVSRRSCENILSKGPGHSCMIVVGGAAEALYAFPGRYDLVLQKRYGFIKLALQNGAHLVPVIGFGETDIWEQVPNPPGSLLRKIQKTFQRIMSFSPPLFHGRGIFQYDVGIIPFRRQIVTVVGKPLVVPHIPDPSHEQIRTFHIKYMDALKELFDEFKDEFAPDRKSDLRFVE